MRKNYWQNAYWVGYRKLEQRVIELSNSIYFDDTQMSVYSNEIADLILSVVAKIESITKDYYETHIYPFNFDKNNKEYSDSFFYKQKVEITKKRKWEYLEKLNLVIKETFLSDKIVILNSNVFKFSMYDNEIKPFGNFIIDKGKMGGIIKLNEDNENDHQNKNVNWHEAYISLKHNYSDSIPIFGNLLHLTFAMAALFLLIIYFEYSRSNRYIYNNQELENNYFDSLGSELFSVKIHYATDFYLFKNRSTISDTYEKKIDQLESVLLKIQHPAVFRKMEEIITAFKIKYPEVDGIDINRMTSVHVDTKSVEYIIYSKLKCIDEKNIINRMIILNEFAQTDKIWAFDENKEIQYDQRFINKTKKFLSEIKVGDLVEIIDLMGELIECKISEIDMNSERLTINKIGGDIYKLPMKNIKIARIKAPLQSNN